MNVDLKRIFNRTLLQNIVIVLYFSVLAAECYFLYGRYYFDRVYTRPLLLPLLFLVFLQQFISRNHLLIIGAMICSCLGDVLTIRFEVFQQWMGLGCYGLSFVFLGVEFFKIEWFSLQTSKRALFFSVVGLVIYFGIMEYFLNTHNQILPNKILVYGYACAIAFLSLSILNVYFNNKAYKFRFALIAVGLLILANLTFQSSIYYFHRRSTLIDVVTAAAYGSYLFIMIKGVMRVKEKISGTEYFKQI